MNLLKKQPLFLLVITWRFLLFIIAIISPLFIPQFRGFPYVNTALEPTGLPYWIWSFGNFDGVHYLRLAVSGYTSEYTQAFFPAYPLLINLFSFSSLYPEDTFLFLPYLIAGLVLSFTFFVLGLLVFNRLIADLFNKETAFRSIVLLMSIPTAFYFTSIYTESLFFFLVVLTFYFLNNKKFLFAGIVIMFATATKFLGIVLVLSYLIEMIVSFKNESIRRVSSIFIRALIGLLMAPMGLLCYMLYLQIRYHDPLLFYNAQPFFGAERTANSIILLPQVIFRYLKIFLTVDMFSMGFMIAALEFIFTLVPLVLLIVFFRKMRFSYWIFSFFILIIPTLTGTLSSMPRYALMTFMLLPVILSKYPGSFKFSLPIMIILEIILVSLFVRGYWIA